LVQAAGATARLVLEVVAHVDLLLHQLAAASETKALLGTGVGLLLWHCYLLFLFSVTINY
jgi:hypothetical protein